MKLIFSIAITLLTFVTSCTEFDVESPYQVITFKPTQCSNPWDLGDIDENKTAEERFGEYLSSNGISEIKDFSFDVDTNIYCSACSCLSNKTYTFKVKVEELPKLRILEPFQGLDI